MVASHFIDDCCAGDGNTFFEFLVSNQQYNVVAAEPSPPKYSQYTSSTQITRLATLRRDFITLNCEFISGLLTGRRLPWNPSGQKVLVVEPQGD